MEKKKNVTIPEELFIDLVKYFLADIRWDEDTITIAGETGSNGETGTVYPI